MTTIVRGRRESVPISMEEAVGYSSISCRHDARVEGNLVLKYDRLFCLLDPHGNITPPGACGLGLFQDDTRMLSRYELHAAGGPPVLLSAQIQRMFQAQIDLAVTDTAFGGDPWSASNRVHLRREIVVDDVLTERVTLTSFLSNPIDYWVEIALACDFADIFEVRGWTRRERGEYFAPVVDAHSICYGYRGRDGRFV
jgi:glycogen debranching enzyme